MITKYSKRMEQEEKFISTSSWISFRRQIEQIIISKYTQSSQQNKKENDGDSNEVQVICDDSDVRNW